jgi:hypothetical protein
MARSSRTWGKPIALVGAGLLVASTVPAVAAPAPATPADFDAPIFGTTATLAEGRMPTYAQVRCSDARCTSGVVPGAEGGATAYVSTTVARGGVFAESPYFVAKLNKHWSNSGSNAETAGGQAEGYSTFTINLAQILPGADIPALVAADVAKYDSGTVGAPTTVAGATVWPATADHRKGLWSMVYVSKGDALARGVCIQYGNERGSATCPVANLQALTVGAVTTPASTQLAEQGSIRGLVPRTPAGLTPILLNIEPTKPLWANNLPSPALERSLAKRKNSVAFQYGVTKFPGLLLDAKVAALSSENPARPWTETICTFTVTTEETCDLRRIKGPAFGYIGVTSDPAKGGKPTGVYSHFTGSGKLGDVSCSALRTEGTMTPEEVAACTKAITALSTAVVSQ